MEIKKIIQIQINDLVLEHLPFEINSQTEDRFFAYVILPVGDERFSDLFNNYLKHRSHSSRYKPTEEELKKYRSGPSRYEGWAAIQPFADKSLTEQIEEGRFSHVTIIFSGCFFEEEWYIMDSVAYYENFLQEEVERSVKEMTTAEALQSSPTFRALPDVETTIDIRAMQEKALQENAKVTDQMEQTPYEAMPKKVIRQYPNMRCFVGQPSIVAHIKQEAKEKLNRQYENYMNETIFFPFVKALQYQQPEEFQVVHSLYGMNYPLIYPNNKDHVMAVIKALNSDESVSRLYYFLYDPFAKKMYEWTRPVVRPAGGFHVFFIQEDLAGLSDWGNDYDIPDPSVTMDDPHFWNEYVFKKENGAYVFLKEVHVKNNRKDIYPGF